MSDELTRYLAELAAKLRAAGLDAKAPGNNWISLRDIVPGSHISVSVRKDQIQVNLNNATDADRRRYLALYADRQAIERALGEGLGWEKKEGTKKTAIRVTRNESYEVANRDEQHRWVVDMMKTFERVFGPRLATLG